MTAARLQRYALLLAGYQYDIVYRKTSDHGNADGLSRLPINSPATDADADGDTVETFHVSQFDPLLVTAEQVRRQTRRDPTLAAVYQAVQTGDLSTCTDHRPYYHQRSELTSHQGCLLWVHAASFHLACNRMSWTSFTVRTAVSCAQRNSLAAMCGGRCAGITCHLNHNGRRRAKRARTLGHSSSSFTLVFSLFSARLS